MSNAVLHHSPPQPQPNIWASMPGWGIVADLTPPAVVAARSLRRLRNLIIALLVLVVLACVAGYVWASRQASDAAAEGARAQDETLVLQGELNKYSAVTRIEAATSGIQAKISALLAGDVNVAKLTANIRSALPGTMSINNLTINIPGASMSGAPAQHSDTPGLSGATQIGTVTISGAARNLNGLPLFVDHLNTISGVANVVPTSNQASSRSVTFTVNLVLTDALYSHRFDHKHEGGR